MHDIIANRLANRTWIGVMSIGCHTLWGVTNHCNRLAKEPLCRLHISLLASERSIAEQGGLALFFRGRGCAVWAVHGSLLINDVVTFFMIISVPQEAIPTLTVLSSDASCYTATSFLVSSNSGRDAGTAVETVITCTCCCSIASRLSSEIPLSVISVSRTSRVAKRAR